MIYREKINSGNDYNGKNYQREVDGEVYDVSRYLNLLIKLSIIQNKILQDIRFWEDVV